MAIRLTNSFPAKQWLTFVSFLLLFTSCFPPGDKVPDRIIIDFNQADQQRLRNFQDQLNTDSLATYLKDADPSLRYLAALGFGSLGTKEAKNYIDTLGQLLNDDYYNIRSAAAFSLGQIADPAAAPLLTQAFQKTDSLYLAKAFRKNILEAVGKCADKKLLPLLAAVDYSATDTLILEGQALGIYHFGLRGFTDPKGTKRMADYLQKDEYDLSVNFIAANYFFRNPTIDFNEYTNVLIKQFQSTEDPRVRMALAIVLGRTKDANALDALFQQFPREQDFRVKCNILRALGNFNYREVEPIFSAALNNKNFHLSKTATDFFLEHGTFYDCQRYIQRAKLDTALHINIRHQLLGAANKHLPFSADASRFSIMQILEKSFVEDLNIENKCSAIDAIGQFGWYYRRVFDLGKSSPNEIVRSRATQVLKQISDRPDFDAFFGAGRNRVRRELANFFSEAISSKNVGAMAHAAQALVNPDRNYPELFTGTSVLSVAKSGLDLPKEVETFDLLQKTIDHFNGVQNINLSKPNTDYKIDWEIFGQLPLNPVITLVTDRGDIKMELFPNAAPGSVVNIYQLTNSGFFNGLNFHRVIANFVIQGGCPRGDGYGSLDYSIRSEFSQLKYDQAGMVGMASAGPHTECTQFFITHGPAMHLNGRYTIFGKVIEGLNVVHSIEPGDKIIRATTN